MKSTELRIGNLIQSAHGSIVIVETISPMTVGMIPSNSAAYDCISPIPLTEEWLARFGFEYERSLSLYMFEHMGFKEGDLNTLLLFYGEGTVNCQYVHQLQNIVFALTGEELKLLK